MFNQLTLHNYLNGKEKLGTPKLRAAVFSLTSEQSDNKIGLLECSTEELANLPDSQGIQEMVNVHTLLDYHPLIGPNTRGILLSSFAHRVEGKVAPNMLLNLKKYLFWSRTDLISFKKLN